ncbi:MAG: DUF917 family protein [Sulfolobales archaeon]|nr:DUF917 family protein [Sulfolobales archaeon]MDW8083477.1 DUF917 family protein [Sulfolobales archaeon]
MKIKIDEKVAEAAILGGSFFGGGGGGDIKTGLMTAKLAVELGDLYIVDLDELPSESLVVTASLVGAPAAKEKYVKPTHMVRSAELLRDRAKVCISGFISSENGGASTANGWIPAAVLNIPVVDAPADGRAHPTGVMGSMGLHRVKDYLSIQAAVGGSREAGTYVELVAAGSLARVDRLVREASVQAGGMVAVTRNPVNPEYLKENAAVGGLSKAMEVGKIMQKHYGDAEAIAFSVIEYLGGGQVVDKGTVESVFLETRGGYDIGRIVIRGESKYFEVLFWNEYMTLEEIGGARLATFPDLIVTLNTETSLPLTSAEIKIGDKVVLMMVPKDLVPLGAGVKDPEIIKQVEVVVGKKLW